MDFKSVPSDSLYKFASIFCLGLLLACVVAFVTVTNQYGAAREKYNDKLIEIDYEAATKGEMTPQKQRMRKTYSDMIVFSREDARFYLFFILAGIVSAIVGAIWGFKRWMVNLQQYIDQQVQLETQILMRKAQGENAIQAAESC